jgi:hypothetical protein
MKGFLVLAGLVLALVLSLAGCSRPSPVQAACTQLARTQLLTGASAPACVACVTGGGQYMWADIGGGWKCYE